ncbi:MAG: hypothetical protein AB1644_10280 [Candidatus Zixiibacteriota bacterium]
MNYKELALISSAAVFSMSLLVTCSKKSTAPKILPRITQFSAAPTDIAPGDSSLITYAAADADSLVLSPGSRLPSAQSGTVWIKPAVPTGYTLTGYNKDGRDSAKLTITMSSVAAQFTLFDVSQDTIVINDSTLLNWTAVRADSVVLYIGQPTLTRILKFPSAGAGATQLKPTSSAAYTAIAFGVYGRDTASLNVRVEIPSQIIASNGLYYKGAMGSNSSNPSMQFWVRDVSGQIARKAWMKFRVIEGDGALSVGPNDSLRVDASGTVTILYNFSSSMGHAVVRGVVTGYDSVDVYVRANTLIPKVQGQYVLLKDTYSMVKAFNGAAPKIDIPDSNYYIIVANYEASLGVVFVLFDQNTEYVADDADSVWTVIVNTVYAGTTAGGIGIGSNFRSIVQAYGVADSMINDPTPDTLVIYYGSLGLTFYCGTNLDTVVAEIHLDQVSGPPMASSASTISSILRGVRSERYVRKSSGTPGF